MARKRTPTPIEASPISSIRVQRLHGKFDYEIDLLSNSVAQKGAPLFSVSEDRLSLLYGSNGTGKTTLLRLLFDGLSAAPNRHHRTAIYRTKFLEFHVEFLNGDRVSYVRNNVEAQGFVASVVIGGEQFDWEYVSPASAARASRVAAAGGGRYERHMGESGFAETEFITALTSLSMNPVFLTDTRNLISDVVDLDRPDEELAFSRVVSPNLASPRGVDQIVQSERESDVRDALQRARDYLRSMAFTGAQRGSERVDTVYARLVETIVKHEAPLGRPRKSTIPALRQRVTELEIRSRGFTRFGLLPEPPAHRLVKALERAEPKRGPLLDQVLTPYLDGLSERMDELEAGRRAMAGFVDTIDSFLDGKRFHFHPNRGAIIVDEETREQLEVTALSSGEKQILLLFSDVVALRERTRLFIIDEPEISLNPAWQRKLMPALLASTEDTPMQLVAATHSIEIMAKYQRRLRELRGTEGAASDA